MEEMTDAGEKADVVLLDPPRTGSSEKFLSALVRMAPKKVVYVSCNPETLARDMKYLCGKGYRMERGVAVDMFPFVKHVETCVLCRVKVYHQNRDRNGPHRSGQEGIYRESYLSGDKELYMGALSNESVTSVHSANQEKVWS